MTHSGSHGECLIAAGPRSVPPTITTCGGVLFIHYFNDFLVQRSFCFHEKSSRKNGVSAPPGPTHWWHASLQRRPPDGMLVKNQ